MTLTGHYFWPGAIMLSAKAWDSLSDEQKAAVEAAGLETTAEAYALAAAQEDDTITFLTENGVSITELSDIDAMQQKTAPVVEDWTARDPLVARIADTFRGGS